MHSRKARIAALCLSVLPGVACADTGVYWTFVNNTSQDIHLVLGDIDVLACWLPWTFRDDNLLPAGRSQTFYLETGCTDMAFTVQLHGAGYDGSRVRIWSGDANPLYAAVTRHVQWAYSAKPLWKPAPRAIGSSSEDLDTAIRFNGRGWYDTIEASVQIAPGHTPLPPGSYTDSCNADYDAASGVLRTDCVGPRNVMRHEQNMNYKHLCKPGTNVLNDHGQPLCEEFSDSVPPGSYRDSCTLRDFDPRDGKLRVDCLNSWGWLQQGRELNYTHLCAPGSPVVNADGKPLCEQLRDELPQGSYLDSCTPVDFDSQEGLLSARCQDHTGENADARLETYYRCAPGSTLSNDDGTLRCDTLFTPEGSYTSQCSDIRYDDGVLQASCRTLAPLGTLRLDYQQTCAPRSTVRVDNATLRLACDTPKPG